MAINVKITNMEPEGSKQLLEVTVLTVGNLEEADEHHQLAPQREVTVQVHARQFVMVDEHDLDHPHKKDA